MYFWSRYKPITVELARLSIWIHTFVPGLPLSLLDHNLIQGNFFSRNRITFSNKKKLNSGEGTLLSLDADKILSDAAEPLKRLARLSDASIKDIQEGRLDN